MARPDRIVVIGAGAIGASVGALLFDVGVPCVLVARGEHGRAIAAHGVDLRFPSHARRIVVPTVFTLAESAPTVRDLVIIATMGHHTESAVADLDRSIVVASFQNGTAPLDLLMRLGHPTLAAMVYVPAERREPGRIALSGAPNVGTIVLGTFPSGDHPWASWLVDRLREAGFQSEAEADIAPWIRAKLLINLAGIAFALCEDPPSEIIRAAEDEAKAAWRSSGTAFKESDALLTRIGPFESVPVDGRARVGGSTRHALSRGDSLETENLHANIVETGRAYGVPTPVNTRLIQLAERASRERWSPGCLSADDLRALVFAR